MTILTTNERAPDRLEAQAVGRLDAVLAGLLAPSLDRKLASGYSPESHRLLAIRAQILVAPGVRRALARTLAAILEEGKGPGQIRRGRVRTRRDRIVAADAEMRAVITCLSLPLPVPARGVAMVTCLLRDGTGPLYNRNCTTDLRSLLRHAMAALDPSGRLDWSA